MVQTNSVKNKIIVIGGPTAVGKSSVAIDLALRINGEVVSADSMQIYRGMDIGTGKVTPSETKGITHHMLDIVLPDCRYSAGRYLQDVVPVIENIISRGKVPIVVGGTGLYINALLNGLNFSDADKSDSVREKWKNTLLQKGNEYVYGELKKIDPVSAEKISVNDTKRIVRALEIYEVTGKTKSESISASDCAYDYLFFVLNDDRESLYQRINARVDEMFESGLYEEVLSLKEYSQHQSMQAIGYKQIIEFLDGKYASLADAVDAVKKLSRNYAKRQLTFFKGIKANNKIWIDYSERNKIFTYSENFLGENDVKP